MVCPVKKETEKGQIYAESKKNKGSFEVGL